MFLGMAVGIVVGAATHRMGMWLPIGLALGMLVGLVVRGRRAKDDERTS